MQTKTCTLFLFLLLTFTFSAKESFSIAPTLIRTSAEAKSITAKQMRISQMKVFVSMSVEDYGKLRGKKLNFFERLTFKASQHRMKALLKRYNEDGEPTVLDKIGWVIKGLLVGPIAVLLAYIFLKDDQRELIKFAWFGFIGFAAIVIILLSM